MLIEEKYFDQDKNYLLKSVQAFSKHSLIREWVVCLLDSYKSIHNPLGLMDDFMLELEDKIMSSAEILDHNYDLLAAIYRLEHGDNQLAFQWDGRSHMEVYDAEWKMTYRKWVADLSRIKEVQISAIKYAVSATETNSVFLSQSLRRGLLQHFKLKLRSKKLRKISA